MTGPADSQNERKRLRREGWEVLGVLCLTIALIRLCFELRAVKAITPFVSIIVALILLTIPEIHALWRREATQYLDRTWKQFRQSLLWFAITFVILIIPFFIANHYWQDWIFDAHYRFRTLPNIGTLILNQLFLVALPEEYFFRGWLQTRLNRLFPNRWRILGVPLGYSWILTAALFSIAHTLIHYQWWHFSIIFSALLFGWLREKTGSISAATLWHCFGNIIIFWVNRSYL